MISNFALLLSHEGIKLAHRTSGGWAELGHVSLLDEDLPLKLEQLRKQAETLSVTEFSSKIVLPHDQIKYLTLPNVEDDQREEAIKEALERATPYLIEDLVYDWEEGEDGMNVAAVARDTMSEAESFVVQYGFNPISFVAAPDDAVFSVEPFFGSCSNVAADADINDNIEAEVDKVILSGPTEAPMAEVVDDLESLEDHPETAPEEEPQAAPEPDSDGAADDAGDDDSEATDDAEADEDDAPKTPRLAPLVADRDEDFSDFSFRTIGPATSTSILGGAKPAIQPAPAVGIDAEHDSDVEDRSFPSWAGAAEKNAPFSVDEDIEPSKIGWLRGGKKDDVDDSQKPPSWMKTDDDVADDGSEFEEEQEVAAWIPATAAAPIKQPLFDEVDSEADKLEIFGNRGDRDRPAAAWNLTWIAAIVIVVLLLIGGSFFGLRYLNAPSDPQIAEPEQNEPILAVPEDTGEVAVEPEAPVQEVIEAPLATEEPTPEVEVAEPEPVVDLPPVEATTEFNAPTNTATVDETTEIGEAATTAPHDGAVAPEVALAQPESELAVQAGTDAPAAPSEPVVEEALDPEPEILTAAPTAAEMAPVRPGEDTDTTATLEAEAETDVAIEQPVAEIRPADLLERADSEWTSLSIEAREARYAATGIWPLAPEAPPSPTGERVGSLFLATIDPVVFATDAYAITAEADLLSDKALTAVPNPPAPGTRFARDERGLVAATPEGALTPDGITVFQGIPPQLPPLAPRPDPVDQQEAQRAALAGKIPQLRPTLEVPNAEEAEAAAEPETVASRAPPLRPAAIEALAAEPEAPVNPLALDQTPMPRLRPNNIGEIIYNTERAAVEAQTTTAVAPSNNTVASSATETDALSLRGINLIGIYGEAGDRRALIRLQSGRYTKIEVGDRLNGGQVSAIDQDRVLYIRNGQTVVLRMPSN